MRWPNRHPHSLTPGMRHAQGVMAHLARLINWRNFAARNGSDEVRVSPEDLLVYACRDDRQAVAWVLRDREALECEGDLPFRPLLTDAAVELPPPASGTYLATCVDTHNGHTLAETLISSGAGPMRLDLPPFRHDIAIAIRPAD
jgi:mannan endo-1,4-beta-mannosidase